MPSSAWFGQAYIAALKKSCHSYRFNSLNFDSEKISVITLWNHLKGTSRGPEALQSHLNDSYYTNVLCWSVLILKATKPWGFITKEITPIHAIPPKALDIPSPGEIYFTQHDQKFWPIDWVIWMPETHFSQNSDGPNSMYETLDHQIRNDFLAFIWIQKNILWVSAFGRIRWNKSLLWLWLNGIASRRLFLEFTGFRPPPKLVGCHPAL